MSTAEGFHVEHITEPEQLKQIESEWLELAENVIDRNIFFEPWFIYPLFEYPINIGNNAGLSFLLVKDSESTLIAFIPLLRLKARRFLPVTNYTILLHGHSLMSTPLIRKHCTSPTIQCLVDWLDSGRQAKHLIYNWMSDTEYFPDQLIGYLNEHHRLFMKMSSYERGIAKSDLNYESYIQSALSSKSRGKIRRKQRRLSELGEFTVDIFNPEQHSLTQWLEEFIEVESKSWKMEHGGAFKRRTHLIPFLQTITSEAVKRNRLFASMGRLDGKPIACYLGFVSNGKLMIYKPAYDETYKKYSPGILLLLEILKRVQNGEFNNIQWIDSCSSPDVTFYVEHFSETSKIQDIRISSSHLRSKVFLKLLQLKKYLARK